MMRARLLSLFPFAVLGLIIWLVPWPWAPTPTSRHVTVRAEQFAFDPPVLHVNQGDRVTINLQAVDVVHGLYLDDYGLDARVEPGVSQQIQFVADKAGKFRYRCSVACGSLHPFMIGELVVRPNLPFFRAAGLVLVVLVGTLFYLWRFPPQLSSDLKIKKEDV